MQHKVGDLLVAYNWMDTDPTFVLGIICKVLSDSEGTIKYAIDWTNTPYDSIAYTKGDVDGFKEILAWVQNQNTK